MRCLHFYYKSDFLADECIFIIVFDCENPEIKVNMGVAVFNCQQRDVEKKSFLTRDDAFR